MQRVILTGTSSSELRQEAGHIARAASLGDTAAIHALLGIGDAAWPTGVYVSETEQSLFAEADAPEGHDDLDDGEELGHGLGY